MASIKRKYIHTLHSHFAQHNSWRPPLNLHSHLYPFIYFHSHQQAAAAFARYMATTEGESMNTSVYTSFHAFTPSQRDTIPRPSPSHLQAAVAFARYMASVGESGVRVQRLGG